MFGGGGKGPMGGGGMLRAASRAVARAGVAKGTLQEPISSSSNASSSAASRQARKLNSSSGSSNLTISASGSPLNLPISATSELPGLGLGFGQASYVGPYDEFDWVSVDGSDDDEFVLGTVPSVDEVQDAVSALQQVFDASPYRSQLVKDKFEGNYPTGLVRRVPSFGSELDRIEPSMQPSNPRMLQPQAYDRVYDAFHLLRTEPSVQRMVISLSSDKAIWDAVMNNEAVREIRESYNAGLTGADGKSETSDQTPKDSNPAIDFVKWIFENAKAKSMEVYESITKLMTEFFKPQDYEKTKAGASGLFEERLRTSFMLSVVVLLVVVVARAGRA